MTTAVLINHVAAYAAAVRRHLGDLSPEQVEDLTDGLEADLAEALDDPTRPITGEIPVTKRPGALSPSGEAPTEKLPVGAAAGPTSVLDLTARFGSPEAYAEELRSAAGLPLALPEGSRRPRRSLFASVRARSEGMIEGIVSHRRWPAVRDFLLSLRPVWWVLRAWALFFVVASVFGIPFGLGPRGLLATLLFGALLVASVQHGRGIWSPPARFARAVTALTVLAIVVLPFAASAVDRQGDGGAYETYVVETAAIEDGVYLDGEPVRNLFVYGPDGLPIDGARIVDEDLRPVVTGRVEGVYDAENDSSRFWEPREDEQGREVWNAYPLGTWSIDGTGGWTHPDGVGPGSRDVVVPAPPVAQLAPLAPVPPVDAPVDPTADPSVDPAAVPAPDPAAPVVP